MSKTKSGLPDYRSSVSLIPGGTMQFLDLGFDLGKTKRLKTEYFEYQNPADQNRWSLRCIVKSDEGDFYLDAQTNAPVIDARTGSPDYTVMPSFAISADKALEPFLDQWVPLPFFRAEPQFGSTEMRHRHGPTDWARIKVVALPEPNAAGHTHRAVIAFDTHVQEGIDVAYADPSEGYPALSESDVQEGVEFMLFSSIKNNAWFVGLDWVNEWLKDLFYELLRKKRPNRALKESDIPNQTEYLGRYIAFLELLNATGEVPKVRLINPHKHIPIDVDLVLDIGNSRTIGMLIEKRPDEILSLNNGSILELRDLSSPMVMHRNTFSSQVCFAQAQFGSNAYARGAGRIKQSFSWPSVVRVGPEASRLAVSSLREQGETSMSSPKRYLWDMNPRMQQWRFAPDPQEANAELPVTLGDFVGFVNNEGFPTHAFDKPRFGPADGQVKNNPYPVTDPLFSRSSLMMFLLGEILAHALVQINSPAQRGDRPTPDIPRRLRRVILTVPPAMSVSERKIFQRWASWAVDVLWQALQWDEFADNTSDYRCKPETKVNLDEASATQLVFVYNEIAEKFSGDSSKYFDVFGKLRPSYSAQPSLRVASIDIGGGTTDMVVTTYLNESTGPTNIIVPKQDFREGFNVAGDDVLRAVIEDHIIPELIKFFELSGASNARGDIRRKLVKDAVGVSQRDRNLRAQFAQQILVPLGLKVLQLMEKIPVEDLDTALAGVSYAEVFSTETPPNKAAKSFLDDLLPAASLIDFSFDRWTFNLDMAAVGRSIATVIGPYLRNLAEVVKLWDCDYLVLSGRPSCQPVIQAVFRKTPPVAPSRIIPMCDYPIESWYPFWTPDGKIDDPKTTGVVGAMLSAISEGNLMNFHFRTSELKPASTIKFIGPMRSDRQIRNADLFFDGKNLDLLNEEDLTSRFEFAGPMYIGFRQIQAERWKTTPFYFISFASTLAAERSNRHGMPYTIHFSYQRRFDDDVAITDRSENEGVVKIEEIIARDGTAIPPSDIDLQLKSLWEELGHWFDTGLFDVH